MADRELQSHLLHWTPDRVARFWDFAASPSRDDEYFSKQVGKGLTEFLGHIVRTRARLLDYGSGPGHLVAYLLNDGFDCEAVDFSQDSVDMVNDRFRNHRGWGSAELAVDGRLPYPDGSFETITCIETIEHVLPEYIPGMLRELYRVLKPGTGRLLVTTPFAEVLERNHIYCAECGSIFHRWQHLRSFTRETLAELFESHGFRTLLCDNTDFSRFQRRRVLSPLNWSARYLFALAQYAIATFFDLLHVPSPTIGGWRLRHDLGHGAHLFWLGTTTA